MFVLDDDLQLPYQVVSLSASDRDPRNLSESKKRACESVEQGEAEENAQDFADIVEWSAPLALSLLPLSPRLILIAHSLVGIKTSPPSLRRKAPGMRSR